MKNVIRMALMMSSMQADMNNTRLEACINDWYNAKTYPRKKKKRVRKQAQAEYFFLKKLEYHLNNEYSIMFDDGNLTHINENF